MYLISPRPADSTAVLSLCTDLQQAYPFLQRRVIGHSVCGRAIPALTVGNGKRAVLFAAAFHGQEWLTSLVALRLCEELCRLHGKEPLPTSLDLSAVTARTVVIVPQVNPDGVDIALHGANAALSYAPLARACGANSAGLWQANARGVDLNHNFNAGWKKLQEMERKKGIVSACARQWGGSAPESEPETAALCALCRQQPFSHVAALHTQGEEIYWQYGERTPPHAHIAARLLGAVSGYCVAHPDGLASHGGFKDWFIAQTGRMGFTFELGRGINPLPLDDFEALYQKAREMLLLTAAL